MSYHWSFYGTNIAGSTTATLAFANAQTTNAGSYTVVVTNSAGSITSSVASLTVTNPGISLSTAVGAILNEAGFTFQFSVPIGITYVVDASTDLQAWTPISTNLSLSGSVAFTDAAAVNFPGRYYRVRVQ